MDGGILGSTVDGHALEGLVASSFGIKRRRLDGHDIRFNLERVVVGIDRDVVGAGCHPDGLSINMARVKVKGIELIDSGIGQPPGIAVHAVRNKTVIRNRIPIISCLGNALGERNPGHLFNTSYGGHPGGVETVSTTGHRNVVVGSPGAAVHGTQDVERTRVVVFQAGFYIGGTLAAKGSSTLGMQGQSLIGHRTAGCAPAIGSRSVYSASRFNRCTDCTTLVITCFISYSYR